jgi:NYN domain
MTLHITNTYSSPINAEVNNTQQLFHSSSTCNWAFIDIQNLYKAIKYSGWKLDLKKFREYLAVELNVIRAILFMGYIERNEWLYKKIKKAGFEIEFRNVRLLSNGMVDGGNVDADIASFVMDNKYSYNKAVVVANDGDYAKMCQSLVRQNKLAKVISSNVMKRTSNYIKQEVPREMIMSINSIRPIVESRTKVE